MPLTPRDVPSLSNKNSKDINKLKGISETLKNDQQQQQENASSSSNIKSNTNNQIPSPPKSIKSSSLSNQIQSSPRRMSCVGTQRPIRGSVYEKSKDEVEFERLQFSTGEAQKILNTTKKSLKNFEKEIWMHENKRGKQEISKDKMILEINEIDKLILNLKPSYEAVCKSLEEKMKLKQIYLKALKNANSKTNMLLDFQKIESEAALQSDMELLKRAALLINGKKPKDRKTKGNGDRRSKNLRISSSVEKRKEGFKELPNIQDIAKLVSLSTST